MQEWGDEILRIAYGWVFDDVEESIPSSILIPFENPDYFNWETYYGKLDSPKIYKSIAIGFYKGKRIGILKSKFGSSSVCFSVHLLANQDVKRIIGIGYCGGIHPDFRSGTIVMSESVSRVSCTSRRYLPIQADIPGAQNLLHLLTAAAIKSGVTVLPTRVYSSDDILLQSSRLIQTLYNTGIHAIDMECGALYAMGQFFSIDVAGLMVVSDNPYIGSAADYKSVDAAINHSILISLDALSDEV